jgi:PleD family two-component response regulator
MSKSRGPQAMGMEQITKRGVLVADASSHMAALIGVMLRTIGRKDIREAYDAARAMLELHRRPFDLLIIDMDLPSLDGVAFTRKLRSDTDCRNRHIPIIMMSSTPEAKRIAEARDAGVTEFLRKPFAASHLQTRLDAIAANPRGFIDNEGFKGPDRRRRVMVQKSAERRTGRLAQPG